MKEVIRTAKKIKVNNVSVHLNDKERNIEVVAEYDTDEYTSVSFPREDWSAVKSAIENLLENGGTDEWVKKSEASTNNRGVIISNYEDKSRANANVTFDMIMHFAKFASDELIEFAKIYPLMLSEDIVGEERALNIESAGSLLIECSDFIKDSGVAKAVAREGSHLLAISKQIRIALKDNSKD